MSSEVKLGFLNDWIQEALVRWKPGSIIGLSGPLGAGKTTLVRSVCCARGLDRVQSPTFVVHQSYPDIGIEHFDLYRFDHVGESELLEIGYFEAIHRTRAALGFCFIEWPENAQACELELNLALNLEIVDHQTRRIIEKFQKEVYR